MRLAVLVVCCVSLSLGADTPATNTTNTHGGDEEKQKKEGKGGGHHGTHWGYEENNGPDLWATLYPESCGIQLKRQSPINLELKQAKHDDTLMDIDLLSQAATANYTLVNNAHTVNLVVSNDILVSGGGLPEGFKVHSLHFHWGGTNDKGSEHTTDGKSYPLEMHIVTYNAAKHASIFHALKGTDSLAVLGVFWEVGAEHPGLNPILENLPKVQKTHLVNVKGISASIKSFDITPLLPKLTKNYYRYLGSLTTPTCNEVVVWTVFETTNTLSQEQLEKFRQLIFIDDHGTEHPIINNYRPTQNLNGRIVKRSFVLGTPNQNGNVDKAKPMTDPGNAASLSGISLILIVTSLLFHLCLHS